MYNFLGILPTFIWASHVFILHKSASKQDWFLHLFFHSPLFDHMFVHKICKERGGRGRNAAGKSIDKIMSLVGNPSLTDLSPLWLWKLMQLLSPLSLSRTGENKSPNTKWNIKQLLIQTYFIKCRELDNKINFVNAELYFSWLNPSCPLPRKSRVILFPNSVPENCSHTIQLCSSPWRNQSLVEKENCHSSQYKMSVYLLVGWLVQWAMSVGLW